MCGANATRGVTPFSSMSGGYRPAICLLKEMWRFASSVSGITARLSSQVSCWFMSSLSGGRGLVGGSGLGPDEQDGAGGVVDHLTDGGPEAVWAGVRCVAVAGEHEQGGRLGGREHLALDVAGARVERGVAAQP